MIRNFLSISLAAILGANLRYLLSRLAARELGPNFPYGTLFINIVGSFIVGLFLVWTTERVLLDPHWRLVVVVGFCGSFTTFSGYAFETMALFERGHLSLMLVNILANNALCLGAVLAGMALARAL
jgi:CrcB protein